VWDKYWGYPQGVMRADRFSPAEAGDADIFEVSAKTAPPS